MLAYVLSLVVGLSSLALYLSAFFFPEVHRKNDFLWSGLGMFYALVLWICAGRITGGVLLGQVTSVTLLSWLGWQTLVLRRQVAPTDQQTAVPTAAEWQAMVSQAWATVSKIEWIAPLAKPIGSQFAKLAAWVEALVATTTNAPTVPPTAPLPPEAPPYVPLTPADFANASPKVRSPTTIATAAIVTAATPVQDGQKRPSGESPLTAIAKQVQGAFKGLAAKTDKPVYVRKQFRKPEAEPTPVADVAAVDVGDRALEVVEASIVETEPTVSPSPSTTVEIEHVPPTEQTP